MYLCIKRGFDILFSVVMIVVMLPVWIFAICAVKLSSPGPLLFSQPRGGLKCRPFISYKFRTMRSDHVHDPTEVMPLNHPHITPLGRFLRRTKIDELPQLFNVFKGDMSVIGPRPTIMDQVNAYDDFQ